MALYDDTQDQQSSPVDAIISPLRSLGINADEARANPALFSRLSGGGVGMPSAGNPAASPVAPVSAPAPAPASRVPAAVSTSGTPQPVVNPANEDIQRARAALAGAPSAADELAQEKALEARRAQDAAYINPRDAQGKVLPQYRPSIGQRIIRGIQGVQRGGILGAVTADYGAPNKQYQRDVAQQANTVAADDQSLSEQARRFKEAREAATGQAAEYRGIAALDKDAKPPADKEPTTREAFAISTAKALYPNDPAAQQKYIDDNGGSADKAPTNYEQTIIAAQNEKDPNGPLHRAAQQMRDTEIRKFQANNPGRQPSETELWAQAFQAEYHRKPNAEEIASRHVAGGGTEGGAAARPGGSAGKTATPGQQAAAEVHKDRSLSKLESAYKWDGKQYVNRRDGDDTMSQDEWNSKKQQIQDDYEAEVGALTGAPATHFDYSKPNQPAATGSPAAVSQTGAPQAPAKITQKAKSGSVIGPAPQGSREGRTGTLPDGTKVVVRNGKVVAL